MEYSKNPNPFASRIATAAATIASPAPEDCITVIISVDEGKLLTKPWNVVDTKGKLVPTPLPYRCNFLTLPIPTIEAVADLVHSLRAKHDAALIRGALKPGMVQPCRRLYRPLKEADLSVTPPTVDDVPRRLLVLDYDVASHHTPDEAALRTLLPSWARECDFVAHLSASSGHPSIKGGWKVHLFILLDRGLMSGEARALIAQTAPHLDVSIYNPVQPTFTADPIVPAGMTDPFAAGRVALFKGSQRRATVPAFTMPSNSAGIEIAAELSKSLGTMNKHECDHMRAWAKGRLDTAFQTLPPDGAGGHFVKTLLPVAPASADPAFVDDDEIGVAAVLERVESLGRSKHALRSAHGALTRIEAREGVDRLAAVEELKAYRAMVAAISPGAGFESVTYVGDDEVAMFARLLPGHRDNIIAWVNQYAAENLSDDAVREWFKEHREADGSLSEGANGFSYMSEFMEPIAPIVRMRWLSYEKVISDCMAFVQTRDGWISDLSEDSMRSVLNAPLTNDNSTVQALRYLAAGNPWVPGVMEHLPNNAAFVTPTENPNVVAAGQFAAPALTVIDPKRQKLAKILTRFNAEFDGGKVMTELRAIGDKIGKKGRGITLDELRAAGVTAGLEGEMVDALADGFDEGKSIGSREMQFFCAGDDIEDVELNMLVEDDIVVGDMSMMVAKPNEAKTFVMLDKAYAIAQGRPWRGKKRTKQSIVIYIAAEGDVGIRRRIAALQKQYGKAPQFFCITHPIDLQSDDADFNKLLAVVNAIKRRPECQGFDVGLIVIDTLSRALAGGNENDSEVMGTFVKRCDAIRLRTGAHLAIVHHTDADGKRRDGRGSTVIPGAVGSSFYIDDRTLYTNKQREQGFDKSEGVSFQLRDIEIGRKADGSAIMAAVVDWTECATGDGEIPKFGGPPIDVSEQFDAEGKSFAEHVRERILTCGTVSPDKLDPNTFIRPKTEACITALTSSYNDAIATGKDTTLDGAGAKLLAENANTIFARHDLVQEMARKFAISRANIRDEKDKAVAIRKGDGMLRDLIKAKKWGVTERRRGKKAWLAFNADYWIDAANDHERNMAGKPGFAAEVKNNGTSDVQERKADGDFGGKQNPAAQAHEGKSGTAPSWQAPSVSQHTPKVEKFLAFARSLGDADTGFRFPDPGTSPGAQAPLGRVDFGALNNAKTKVASWVLQ